MLTFIREFLATLKNLVQALQDNTAAHRSIAASLDALVSDSAFQVRVKKQELTRAGHAH